MSTLTNVIDFKVPKRPKIKEREPLPDQRKIAMMPLKALRDRELSDASIRVLGVLCSYCNRAGITWVGQAKLASDLGVSRQAVTKQIVKLRAAGYVEIVKQGFKGARNNTIRVVFDESIDTATALAVTSRHEDNRSPALKEEDMRKEQELTPDPEGLKRIHDMIKGAVKPVQPPAKSYQIPKGDTITVAKMKKEIAAKKASKEKPIGNPEVANEEASIGNHIGNLEVAQNTEEHSLSKVLRLFLSKGFNVLSNQESIQHIANETTVAELETLMDKLSDRYAAEGLPLPTDGVMLANDLIMLQSDELTARHGI